MQFEVDVVNVLFEAMGGRDMEDSSETNGERLFLKCD